MRGDVTDEAWQQMSCTFYLAISIGTEFIAHFSGEVHVRYLSPKGEANRVRAAMKSVLLLGLRQFSRP